MQSVTKNIAINIAGGLIVYAIVKLYSDKPFRDKLKEAWQREVFFLWEN